MSPPALTLGSLFSGCGGFDLGLEWAGLECKWQVENDGDAAGVLAERWPNVGRWDNVKTFLRESGRERRKRWSDDRLSNYRRKRSESEWVSRWKVDVIAAGFPCQDISFAGKGAGLSGKRSGLWWECARIIRTLRPRYVILENVSALLVRGIDAVLGTLASYGYNCCWSCLQAADVGAPHLRDRVFIVAYRQNDIFGPITGSPRGSQNSGRRQEESWIVRQRLRQSDDGRLIDSSEEARRSLADSASQHRHVEADEDQGIDPSLSGSMGAIGSPAARREGGYLPNPDRQSLAVGSIFGGDAKQELATFKRSNRGPGGYWEFDPADVPESGMGRVVDGISHRLYKGKPRNKMLGNAVPPPVGEYIGRRLIQFHMSQLALQKASP